MADTPTTRPSLLVRLRDARDELAWAQFVDIYGPLIYHYARKQGLQDADAADLTQDSLARVARVIRTWEYDRQRGTFRGWLFTIVRNNLSDRREQQRRREQGSGDSATQQQLAEQPAPDTADAWNDEYRRRLFAWAAAQVESETAATAWQAFWRTAVLGRAAKAVAGDLGMTVAAVYMSRSRVLARIKQQIQLVHEDDDVEYATLP